MFLGLVMDPLLEGFLTSYMSWRWVFFVDGIVALTGLFLTLRYIPNFEGTGTKIDYLGAALFFVFSSTFLLLVSLSSNYGFNTLSQTLLLISILSLLPLAAFEV